VLAAMKGMKIKNLEIDRGTRLTVSPYPLFVLFWLALSVFQMVRKEAHLRGLI